MLISSIAFGASTSITAAQIRQVCDAYGVELRVKAFPFEGLTVHSKNGGALGTITVESLLAGNLEPTLRRWALRPLTEEARDKLEAFMAEQAKREDRRVFDFDSAVRTMQEAEEAEAERWRRSAPEPKVEEDPDPSWFSSAVLAQSEGLPVDGILLAATGFDALDLGAVVRIRAIPGGLEFFTGAGSVPMEGLTRATATAIVKAWALIVARRNRMAL